MKNPQIYYSAKVGVFDDEIYKRIIETNNLFVYGKTVYIYQDGYYKQDANGCILKTIIRNLLLPEYVKSGTIERIYRLFLQDIELQKEFEELNCYPKHWICFKNGMYDTKTGELFEHNPKYFCINQIPHVFKKTEPKRKEAMENFLGFICDENDEREMLLQFIAYSMTADTSQQIFMVLNGIGGTGKSTVIRLIEEIIGSKNMSNISMMELNHRFACIDLMGKLLNSCADLETTALKDTSTLKKLLGEDRIRGEAKGKDVVYFKNYAKLIFSTNQLPNVQNEYTNGFYRRLLIFTMDKKPEKVNTNLFDELREEIGYLIFISLKELQKMYQNGKITISKQSEREIERLRTDSDHIQRFLDEYFVFETQIREIRSKIYKKFIEFCEEESIKPVGKQEFFKILRTKGIKEIRTGGYVYFQGIKFVN